MAELTDIIERLIEANVDFVRVGGLPAVTHGSSMTTQDIDICCDFFLLICCDSNLPLQGSIRPIG